MDAGDRSSQRVAVVGEAKAAREDPRQPNDAVDAAFEEVASERYVEEVRSRGQRLDLCLEKLEGFGPGT